MTSISLRTADAFPSFPALRRSVSCDRRSVLTPSCCFRHDKEVPAEQRNGEVEEEEEAAAEDAPAEEDQEVEEADEVTPPVSVLPIN